MKIEISDLSPEAIKKIHSIYQSTNSHTQNELFSIINNESNVKEIKSRLGNVIKNITTDGAVILAIISDEKKKLNK